MNLPLLLFCAGVFAFVVGAVLFAVALRDLKPLGGDGWREKHHFWWGAVGMALAALSWAVGWEWPAGLLSLVGGLVALDDGYQHHRQAASGDLAYETPLKRWVYAHFPGLSKY